METNKLYENLAAVYTHCLSTYPWTRVYDVLYCHEFLYLVEIMLCAIKEDVHLVLAAVQLLLSVQTLVRIRN